MLSVVGSTSDAVDCHDGVNAAGNISKAGDEVGVLPTAP